MNNSPFEPLSGSHNSCARSEESAIPQRDDVSGGQEIPSLFEDRGLFAKPPRKVSVPVGKSLEQIERAYIQLVLDTNADDPSKMIRSAEMLGISQKTLYNKIKQYGLKKGV